MKVPPTSSHVLSNSWSNMGTLFHTMLLASEAHSIPLFNEYFLPNNYSKLDGMTKDVNNRWGDRHLSDLMGKERVNEAFHNMFGCRTFGNTEEERKLEKLGYDYMAHLEEFGGRNDTIYHSYNVAESISAVRHLTATSSVLSSEEEQQENIVYSQTVLYNWFTQFNKCESKYNHMLTAIKQNVDINYLYESHTGDDRFLGGEEHPLGYNTDFLTVNGFDNERGMEINPWRVVPLKDQSDFVSQYFKTEMVNTDRDSYTPYWTTIDYIPGANAYNLNQDIKSIISDPNVFPITISKSHFLFCHRLLGFFCLRSLHPKKMTLVLPKAVNFRQITYDIFDEIASKHHILFSSYEDITTSGLVDFDLSTEEHQPRGKRIYDLHRIAYEKVVLEKLIPSYELSGKTLKWECRDLATSGAGGSASPKHYARRLKAFYGFCVGMASIKKEKAYKVPSGGHVVADAIIYSFNKEMSIEKELHEMSMRRGSYIEDGVSKPVLFHGPLRSIYKAEQEPMTWGQIVNEEPSKVKVSPPTHISEFIPSWKDLRKPITVNVSGAPPIGFYHKERRCKVCNGRVILTTPPHCKVETVQCPHCRDGKIEVNE